MTAFRRGTLARNSRVVKLVPDVVLRGEMSSHGPFERAFAKLQAEPTRCIEAVCAWIARELALPAPEPVFLRVLRSSMPRGARWPFGNEPERFVFGTLEVGNAQPLTRFESGAVANLVDRWPFLDTAAVFDQLVANDDRTAGNVLLAPRRNLWLIDHGRALGGAGPRLFSSEHLPMVKNFFLDRIAAYSLAERIGRRQALVEACLRAQSAASRIPYAELLVPDDLARQIERVLNTSARSLPAAILGGVGLPELLEGEAPARGPH